MIIYVKHTTIIMSNYIQYIPTAICGLIIGKIVANYVNKEDESEKYKKISYHKYDKNKNKNILNDIADKLSEEYLCEIPESVDYSREVDNMCEKLKIILKNKT